MTQSVLGIVPQKYAIMRYNGLFREKIFADLSQMDKKVLFLSL